ncbi:MAG: ribosomal-protein-alanine N-acetyltransferase [Methanosphaera sp. rholeuAM130]|nr:ribosomal protein S18-alanine N-acetyltransferase [Methanosphaera sp.]RAP52817.1 MAG: ribosomal-protein-alanine N-acetyltransferase [Methanosphaera sp. rholeuAM130]
MDIRNFQISDLDDVLRIQFQSFTDPYPVGILLDLYNKGAGFLVAQVGRFVVGYIIFWIRDGSGHIIAIAVDKRFRSMKIGSVLLENALNLIKSNGIFTVKLEVRKSNITARKFYLKMGFKQIKYCEKYYSDGEDGIIMQYDITGN